MSVEAIAAVLHHSQAKGSDKVILLGIANHDGDGGAYPSLATLARYANLTEKSTRESLRRLEALGEVITHLNAGPPARDGGRTNRYDIAVSCPPGCDRTFQHRVIHTPTSAGGGMWVYPPTSTGGDPPTSTGGEPAFEPAVEPTPQPPTAPGLPESVARLWEGEGISRDDQDALWAAVLADPDTTVPAARARQRAWFVPTLAKIHAAHGKGLSAALAQVRRHGAPCEHDEPGGAELHPTTGLPLCPLCRRKAAS